MIRKIIIVVLTLASMASAAVWILSYRDDAIAWDFKRQGRIGLLGVYPVYAFFGIYSDYKGQRAGSCHAVVRLPADRESEASSHKISFRHNWASSDGAWWFMDHLDAIQYKDGQSQTVADYSFKFPTWVPVLLFGMYPILAFIRGPFRRYRRRKHGLCVTCGYDLRASPERCPECGRKAEAL